MVYRKERDFGFLFAGVFTLVAFWPLWPLAMPHLYWLAGAGLWLLLALTVPRVLAPLYKAWMAFGHALGWVNSKIILGAVFFLVVTPIGFALRLVGKDPLHRRLQKAGDYWVKRDATWKPESMRDQF